MVRVLTKLNFMSICESMFIVKYPNGGQTLLKELNAVAYNADVLDMIKSNAIPSSVVPRCLMTIFVSPSSGPIPPKFE